MTDKERKAGMMREKEAESRQQADWMKYLLYIYLLLMTIVYPLYMRDGYQQLGEAKALLYRNLSLLVLALLAGAAFFAAGQEKTRRIRENPDKKAADSPDRVRAALRRLSWTDRWVIVYGLGCAASLLFSMEKETAFWGLTGWRTGFLTQMFFLVFYFLFSRIPVYGEGGYVRGREGAFSLFTAGTLLVCSIAVLNRFSILSFAGEYENSFISTIGNINWYCGFLSVFLPVAALQSMVEKRPGIRALALAASFIAFASAATQGGASAFIAVGATFLFGFALGTASVERLRRFVLLPALFGAACQCVRVLRVLGGGSGYFNDYYYYNETATGDFLTTGNETLWLCLVFVTLYILLFWVEKRGQGQGGAAAETAGGQRQSGAKEAVGGRIQGGSEEAALRAARLLWRIVLGAALAAAAIYLLLLAVNTAYPGRIAALSGSGLFTFDESWGSARGAAWMVAVRTFADFTPLRMVIGAGEDCFSAACYAVSAAVEILTRAFGGATLRNAHNEWLTMLVNNGVLGAVAYAGIFISAFWRFVRQGTREPYLYVAAGAILSYTLHNMVSFQQVTSTPFIFLLLGMGEELWRRTRQTHRRTGEENSCTDTCKQKNKNDAGDCVQSEDKRPECEGNLRNDHCPEEGAGIWQGDGHGSKFYGKQERRQEKDAGGAVHTGGIGGGAGVLHALVLPVSSQ
ncbi:MAG: hypothetical protein Q4C60_07290 [Eubacteriales bacterium]|nr:hypothetical protein [Eubacteriales bacterium]